jgi:hypothetical protein
LALARVFSPSTPERYAGIEMNDVGTDSIEIVVNRTQPYLVSHLLDGRQLPFSASALRRPNASCASNFVDAIFLGRDAGRVWMERNHRLERANRLKKALLLFCGFSNGTHHFNRDNLIAHGWW